MTFFFLFSGTLKKILAEFMFLGGSYYCSQWVLFFRLKINKQVMPARVIYSSCCIFTDKNHFEKTKQTKNIHAHCFVTSRFSADCAYVIKRPEDCRTCLHVFIFTLKKKKRVTSDFHYMNHKDHGFS